MAYVNMEELEHLRKIKLEYEQNETVQAYLGICAMFDTAAKAAKADILDAYRSTGFKSTDSEHFNLGVRVTDTIDNDKLGLDIISQLWTSNPDALSVSVAGFRKAQKANAYLASFQLSRLTGVPKLTAVLKEKD